MKTVLAWIVGLGVFVALVIGLDFIGSVLGEPSWIDYGGMVTISHGIYDGESYGGATDYGLSALALVAMISVRLGMAIKRGSWKESLTESQALDFYIWLVGIAIFTVASIVLDKSFHGSDSALAGPVHAAISLGILYALFRFFKGYRDDRLRQMEWRARRH